MDSDLESLGLVRILPVYLGDENTVTSKNGGLDGDFLFWAKLLLKVIERPTTLYDDTSDKMVGFKFFVYQNKRDTFI